MVRLLSILIGILCYTTVLAQQVTVLAEYNDFKVAGDMCVALSGNIYVSGRFNSQPMLMKFDSLGNELWIKYYSDQQEYDFGRMIIDKQGNLYIHQSKRYSKLNNFIVKLDPNGNVLWRSDTIQGGRSNSFPFINLMLKEEILSVVHDSRTPDNDNAAPIISQFETETGVLLFQSTIIEDANNPYEISEAPFVDNNWVLSCAKGVLNISPDASYQYTELGDSIPGILMAATEQSFITNWSKQTQQLGDFEQWSSFLYWYNHNWNLTTTKNITSQILGGYDSLSTSIYTLLPIEHKGLVTSGVIAYRSNGNDSSFLWFSQINPDDGSINWEQLMPNTASITLMAASEHSIYAVGALGLSQTGIRLYRINVNPFSYTSQFITSTNPVQQPVSSVMQLYPNPSGDVFNLASEQGIVSFQLYGLDGRLVQTETVGATHYTLRIPIAGVYLLSVQLQDGSITTQKVVKW